MAQPCSPPTNVTANPTSTCSGGVVDLSAISLGNSIKWYTVPSGGVSLGTSMSGANFQVTPSGTTTYYAEAEGGSIPGSQTFSFTGAVQTFTVPPGVTSITVDVKGAKGGGGFPVLHSGGNGGRVQGTITVTPGQVLQINVGGQGGAGSANAGGTGGFNGGAQGAVFPSSYSGGGGGGASDIRVAPYALTDRVAIAGGGGGGAYNYSTADYDRGGPGGGTSGGTGYGGNAQGGQGAGTGGTQSAGGIGGTYSGYCTASNGTLGVGGAGGTCNNSGGGGGGGFYGGGGGVWSGGGGGSSFLSGGTHTQGSQTGNGEVVLSWLGGTGCTASARVPVTVTVAPLTPPSNVTATPSVTCPGATSQLNATSSSAGIDWYDAPSGGNFLGSSLSGANFAVNPTTTTTYYSESTGGTLTGSQTFNYTGAAQNFTVPPGVTSLTVDMRGAQGGTGYPVYSTGGNGGRLQGTVPVTPGQVIQIFVGGAGGDATISQPGAAGFNGGGLGGTYPGSYGGGGGGGASDIRVPPYAIANRIAVAGGGGGGGLNYFTIDYDRGGPGGGLTGQTGYGGNTQGGQGAGTGGTQSAGGIGGTFSGYCTASDGTLGNGGAAGSCNSAGGGGGGGYYGGGGGTWSGGGGGSSFPSGATHTQGFQSSNGQVMISWTGTSCTSSSRTPVTVTMESVPPVANCQNSTVQLDSLGAGSILASAINNGSTDNCAIDTITLSQTTFGCGDAGTNTYILTVTDEAGNTATCSANITVLGTPFTNSISSPTTICGFNVSCGGGSDGIASASTVGGCPGYSYVWSNGATSSITTGLSASTYFVTITDLAGTVVVDTVTLTGPPPVNINSTSTSTCPTDSSGSINISVSGGNTCQGNYGYAWSNGATTEDLTNLPAGSYTVTITDGVGCTSTQSITVTAFTLNPTITASGVVVTSGQTWVSYQWLLNGVPINGATASTYTATVTGSYSLQVTDANGCTAISNVVQVTVVGVADPGGDWNDLSLFPNPARGEFRLRTGSPISYGVTVTITDLAGRRLHEQVLPELAHEVAYDIHRFAPGTYLVEVSSDMGQHKLFRLVVH